MTSCSDCRATRWAADSRSRLRQPGGAANRKKSVQITIPTVLRESNPHEAISLMQMVVPADPKVISVRSAGVPGQPFASMKPSKARVQQANLRAPKRPKMKRAIVVCLGLLAPVCPAAADSPVAVVEEIQGKVTGAEFMDYVTPKSVIKIEGGGAIVLSYLKSCRRETISG